MRLAALMCRITPKPAFVAAFRSQKLCRSRLQLSKIAIEAELRSLCKLPSAASIEGKRPLRPNPEAYVTAELGLNRGKTAIVAAPRSLCKLPSAATIVEKEPLWPRVQIIAAATGGLCTPTSAATM